MTDPHAVLYIHLLGVFGSLLGFIMGPYSKLSIPQKLLAVAFWELFIVAFFWQGYFPEHPLPFFKKAINDTCDDWRQRDEQ
jgi:hypothetical protein